MTTATRLPERLAPSVLADEVTTRVLGAVLALGVAYVHVKDQGGLIGDKTPSYVGVGYWVLELLGVLTAVLLVVGGTRERLLAWYLALGVAVGPMVGYALSRGPGLPSYTDDKGNWTETLGLQSLVVEGLLLVIGATVLVRSRRDAV